VTGRSDNIEGCVGPKKVDGIQESSKRFWPISRVQIDDPEMVVVSGLAI
jgi:hypothetical protein